MDETATRPVFAEPVCRVRRPLRHLAMGETLVINILVEAPILVAQLCKSIEPDTHTNALVMGSERNVENSLVR